MGRREEAAEGEAGGGGKWILGGGSERGVKEGEMNGGGSKEGEEEHCRTEGRREGSRS